VKILQKSISYSYTVYSNTLTCLLLAVLLTIISSIGMVEGMESNLQYSMAMVLALTGFPGSNPLGLFPQFETFEIEK